MLSASVLLFLFPIAIATHADQSHSAVLPIQFHQIRLPAMDVYENSKFPVFYEVS